ncbi:fructokinase [Enterovibrio norvegicus FF-33]|uniref:Fructokinase n=1 Tax=Enterovibrio norvegicus FF-454 TaxID=1185651 RepID=A0A1E5BZA8_9GAMM|nr:fructokinase [Enterovibrio norvegicus]OEE58539.1 fructokinase [Enterovibrio norvegicus FF-454]OEE67425.1 fructokinase [Enterovibrio norvegicus FF-33]OEE80085.1 fructokinase [Enterovibrio norvegicus FF-162]
MKIGIDLGGTKIEVMAITESGEEVFRKRVPTPQHDYQATLRAIKGLVDDAEKAVGKTCSVGLGIPGTLSPVSGLVKNANSVWLNGQPLDKDLGQLLNREVRIANDANCLAVSEAVDGSGAGKHMVFGVIIGTGCGGGIAIDGHVHAGGNGVAGEWGHNPLPWQSETDTKHAEDIPCYCGKPGCLEVFISGTGFWKDFELTTNQTLRGPEIIQMAEKGDADAEACIQRYEDRLARALASVVNVIDPDVIVLGGGMSNVERLYTNVPKRMAKWVLGGECATPVVKAKYGDSSGVRGAAWLW